jgi:hypothetical protein
MIIIARLTKDDVERAVTDLMKSGEFKQAFEGPFERPL